MKWILYITIIALPIAWFLLPDTVIENSISEPFLGGLQSEELVWNGSMAQYNNQSRALELNVGWMNYLDRDGVFKNICADCWTDTGSFFQLADAPFTVKVPKSSLGVASFVNNNRYFPRTHEIINDDPLTMTIKSLGVQDVQGKIERGSLHTPYGYWQDQSYIVYENAYEQGVDLIYFVAKATYPRLEKLVRFRVQPSVFTYSFEIGTDKVVEARSKYDVVPSENAKTLTNKDRLSFRSTIKRGSSIMNFQIWDSASSTDWKKQDIDADIKMDGMLYVLTKKVPQAFFTGATYPVYTDTVIGVSPDANPETSTFDADMNCGEQVVNGAGDSTDFTLVRNAYTTAEAGTCDSGNGVRDDNAHESVQSQLDPVFRYNIERAEALFDSSAIPLAETITAASLRLVEDDGQAPNNDDNDGNDYLAIVDHWSTLNTTSGVATDWNGPVVGATSSAMTEMHDTGARIDVTNITASMHMEFAFNATGISRVARATEQTLSQHAAGISYFVWAEGHDIQNDPIASRNYVPIESADCACAFPPILYATSVVAATNPPEDDGGVIIIISLLKRLTTTAQAFGF